jgi:manganese/zinc/iron transport system permease protein
MMTNLLSPELYQFISLDLPALGTSIGVGLLCALLGNFLVLRRMSLMGDTISHAVLPGIVLGFLVSGSRSPLPVFVGAALIGIITTILVEGVRRLGRVESGAAMGVIFSSLFALGVLLIEQASARSVDLDADCLLHGQLETIFWYPPQTWAELLSWKSISALPSEFYVAWTMFAVAVLFVYAFFKELKLVCFDPALATALGFSSDRLTMGLMVVVAAAVVASFKVVGSILVIAMLIVPAATARLCVDRLKSQITISLLVGVVATIGGYWSATTLPAYFGADYSINAAGMITVWLGVLLGCTVILSPRYGIVPRGVRRWWLGLTIDMQDILGEIYRIEEQYSGTHRALLDIRKGSVKLAKHILILRGFVTQSGKELCLTEHGRKAAQNVVRSHRLWERYLVDEAGLGANAVHPTAEILEHFTDPPLQSRLAATLPENAQDPHGKKIP